MIELTATQLQALETPDTSPPRLVDPRTQETFVLLPLMEYERLRDGHYDDGPWTDEEIDQLRQEACDMLDAFGKRK